MKTMKKIFSLVTLCLVTSLYGLPVYADSFKIQDVYVVEADIIDVEFTRELDTTLTAVREFILEEEATALEIEILLSEVVQDDTTRVTLMLDQFLKENTNYTITVLDIKDFNGNTVEAGIDSVFTFNTGVMTIANSTEVEAQNDMENTDETTTTQDDMITDDSLLPPVNNFPVPEDTIDDELMGIDLNAGAEISSVDANGMAGTTVNSNIANSGVMVQAEQNTSLPETGPEIVLLLLLALMGAGAYTYSKSIRA